MNWPAELINDLGSISGDPDHSVEERLEGTAGEETNAAVIGEECNAPMRNVSTAFDDHVPGSSMHGSRIDMEQASVRRERSTPLVQLSGLTKEYEEGDRSRLVLDHVDAEFVPGELIVVVGRSGSGKTTLLNLISGIDHPTSGTVTVAGAVLTRQTERERTLFRRNHIGFVFQSFNLIPTLSVLENLLLPLELRGVRDDSRARFLLGRVGLETRAEDFPDRLSGGERQRVAVARALAHDPMLILADEPTGNLDVETGARVMDLLESLVREQGRTMIVATHDRDQLARADRVLGLSGGRLQDE